MLLTPHVLVGAAIGYQLDHAYIVAPLAAGSHFLLDLFPHWDLRIDLEVEDLSKRDILVVALDLSIGLMLITLLLLHNPKWEMMLVGGVSAWLPDAHHVVQALTDPKRWRRYFKIHNKYSNVHKRFNWDHDSKFIYGMLTQIIVGLAAILTIIKI